MTSNRERRLLVRAQRQEDIAAGRILPVQHRRRRQRPLPVLNSATITPAASSASATEHNIIVTPPETENFSLDLTDSPLSSVPPSPRPGSNDLSDVTTVVETDNANTALEIDQGLANLLQAIMERLESAPEDDEATPLRMPATTEASHTAADDPIAPPLTINQCVETLVTESTSISNAPQELNVAGYLTVVLPPDRVQVFLCPNLLSSAGNVALGRVLQAMSHQQPAIFQELRSNIPEINLHLGTSYSPVPLAGGASSNSRYGFQPLGRLVEAFASSFVLPFASMDMPETSALYENHVDLIGSRLVVLHIYFRVVYMPARLGPGPGPSLTLGLPIVPVAPLIVEQEATAEHSSTHYLDSAYVTEKVYLEHFHAKAFGTAYAKIHTVRILDTIMDHLDMATHPRRDGHLPDGTSISEDSIYKWARVQSGTHQNSRTFTKKAYCLWKTLEARTTSTTLSSEQQGHLSLLKCLFTSHEIPASWKQQSGLGNLVKQAASLKKSSVDKMVETWMRGGGLDEYGAISWE